MKEVSCQIAKDQNRPVVYVLSAGTDKDELARQIAAKDKITTGLVAILTCVEPCMSFEIYRNKDEKKLELVPRLRKCLFLYHYWIDLHFGWMNARIQSWLPFSHPDLSQWPRVAGAHDGSSPDPLPPKR